MTPQLLPVGNSPFPNTTPPALDQIATRGRLPTPGQLLNVIKQPLAQLMREQVRGTVDVEKLWQYAQIRRNNLYYRGKQNLTLSPSTSGTGLVDYRPITNSTTLGVADRTLDQYYDSVLNWFRGDVNAFISVLGTRSPNVQAMVKDEAMANASRLVRMADRVAQFLRGHWDMDDFHRHLCYGLGVSGTQFGYTRYVSNAAKLGFTSQPRYEWSTVPGGDPVYMCYACGTETPQSLAVSLGTPPPPTNPMIPPAPPVPTCRRCGRPQGPESLLTFDPVPVLTQTTPIQYPNGTVELTLCGPDRVTVPFWIRNLDETPWLLLEEEVDRGALCQAFPELRTKIQQEYYPSSGSQQEMMGRYTRDLFASPTGYVIARRQQRWAHSQVWFSSWVYEYIPNDPTGNFRELLYKIFPDGLKVNYVNGEPFKMSNARLTRNWAACKPGPSETLMGDPYFEDYIQASDTVNDFINMLVESGERSTPLIIFDPDVLEPSRIKDYATLPGEYLPARSGIGDLSKSFFRAPAAEISPQLIMFIEKFVGWVRDISGITPQIWGGGGPEPTARAAEIKRNQSLMRLNTVWNQIRGFEEKVYDNGAYQAAVYSDGRLFTSKGSPDSVDMIIIDGIYDLVKGGWYYRAEEAMPMTPGQRRDWYMNLFQMAAGNPVALQLSGLGDPANLQRFQETVGSADWRTPGLLEREAITTYLAFVAMNAPQPPGPPPIAPGPNGMPMVVGPPPPPMPTTPRPLEELFMLCQPTLVLQVTREFMTSDAGRQVMDTDPNSGWENLLAFLRVAIQANMPPPPPQGAAPGPNGPGPGGPPQPEGPRPGGGMKAPHPAQPDQPGGVAAPPPNAPAPQNPSVGNLPVQ